MQGLSLLGSRGNLAQAGQDFLGKNPGVGMGMEPPSLMVLGWDVPIQATGTRSRPSSAATAPFLLWRAGIGMGGINAWLPEELEQGKIPAGAAEPRRSWWLCVGGGAAGRCQAGLVGRI